MNKIIIKRDGRTPGSNHEGEVDHIREIVDCELSGDNILDEFSRNQELMSEHFISVIYIKEMWNLHSLSHLVGRTLLCSVL